MIQKKDFLFQIIQKKCLFHGVVWNKYQHINRVAHNMNGNIYLSVRMDFVRFGLKLRNTIYANNYMREKKVSFFFVWQKR